MKKLLFAAAAVGFILVLQPAEPVQAHGKVAICHFGGHNGDFVTTGDGCGCLKLGGKVLVNGGKACEKGHKASGDCGADNVGLLDLASCW